MQGGRRKRPAHGASRGNSTGATARIGGKDDASGTVSAALDVDEMPHSAGFDIKPGNTGVMRFGISSTQAVQIPFIVTKLHYEASMESATVFSFDVQMNILAGSVDYPGD